MAGEKQNDSRNGSETETIEAKGGKSCPGPGGEEYPVGGPTVDRSWGVGGKDRRFSVRKEGSLGSP